MVKKILVGVGRDPESDNALIYSDKLGYKLGVSVTAMHIVQEEPIPISWPIKDFVEKNIENERQKMEAIFSELGKKSDLSHIHFKKVAKGNPADLLIEEAKKGGYDLIIIGHRDLPSLKKLFLGSVSSKVVQYIKIPVLVAKHSIGPSKVLFCTDGSIYATEAIRFGGELIKNMNCKALVLNETPWIIEESEKLAKEIAEEGAEILRKMGIDVHAKAILTKDIAKEILKEAEKGDFDLIIMGSRGLSGIHRFLLGSVTVKLVNQTSKSILVYKHNHQTN
jgi:nucleotide-binding universal stress UspA family protein